MFEAEATRVVRMQELLHRCNPTQGSMFKSISTRLSDCRQCTRQGTGKEDKSTPYTQMPCAKHNYLSMKEGR